jgi:hypothetical protein
MNKQKPTVRCRGRANGSRDVWLSLGARGHGFTRRDLNLDSVTTVSEYMGSVTMVKRDWALNVPRPQSTEAPM